MSTGERAKPKTLLLPLVAGQRLTQPTFHKRYEAMPPETRAELVGGVVYIRSRVTHVHGEFHNDISGWLFYYQMFTPGVGGANNATVKLDRKGEPQPDCQLRIPKELGGQSFVDEERYVAGAPELIVEISRSSRRFDLTAKKADYERARVLEYVVVELDPNRVHWFIRRRDHFEDLPPGPDGIFRSEVFPGLWLDADALFAEDRRRLIRVLKRGLRTPEHAAFKARLAEARRLQRKKPRTTEK
jgi:Uma2 family endonuclease